MPTEHLLDGTLARTSVVVGTALLGGHPVWACLERRHRPAREAKAERAFLVAGACLLSGGVTGITLLAADEIAGAVGPRAVVEVLSSTAYGRAVGLHAGFCVALIVFRAFAAASERAERGCLLLVAGSAAAFARTGHAAGGARLWVFQSVHVFCAVVWLAGLFVLSDRLGRRAVSTNTVARFGRLALFAAGTATWTGLLRAREYFRSLESVRSLYGYVLMTKLAFLVGVALLVIRHRTRNLRAVGSREDEHAFRAFDREVACELALAICVVLAAATLAHVYPP